MMRRVWRISQQVLVSMGTGREVMMRGGVIFMPGFRYQLLVFLLASF